MTEQSLPPAEAATPETQEKQAVVTPSLDKTKRAGELKHDRTLRSCRYSRQGNRVAAGSDDFSVLAWEIPAETDQPTPKELLPSRGTHGHDSWVLSVNFSADGKFVISAGGDGRLIWWQKSDDRRLEIVRSINAHQGWIRALEVSPNGKLLATAGNDRTIRLFDSESGNVVAELPGHESDIYSLHFLPDGSQLLSGDLYGIVRFWDVALQKEIRSIEVADLKTFHKGQRVHYGGIRAVTVSPDRQTIVTGGLHKATNPLGSVQQPLLVELDWESGETQRQLEVGETTQLAVLRTIFHPSGLLLAAISMTDSHWMSWNQEKTTALHRFRVGSAMYSADIHPNGQRLMSAHYDGRLRFCDIA